MKEKEDLSRERYRLPDISDTIFNPNAPPYTDSDESNNSGQPFVTFIQSTRLYIQLYAVERLLSKLSQHSCKTGVCLASSVARGTIFAVQTISKIVTISQFCNFASLSQSTVCSGYPVLPAQAFPANTPWSAKPVALLRSQTMFLLLVGTMHVV